MAELNVHRFHAVIVPESELPFVVSHATSNELADALKKYVGKHVQVFPFNGDRWYITRSTTRAHPIYLTDGTEWKIPLFDEVDHNEIDISGALYST